MLQAETFHKCFTCSVQSVCPFSSQAPMCRACLELVCSHEYDITVSFPLPDPKQMYHLGGNQRWRLSRCRGGWLSCCWPVPARWHECREAPAVPKRRLGKLLHGKSCRPVPRVPLEREWVPGALNDLHWYKHRAGWSGVFFLFPLLCICSHLEADHGCLYSASPGVFLLCPWLQQRP